MGQGLDDAQIIDSVLTGGKGTITNKDIWAMEDEKERELLEDFMKKGIKPPGLEGSMLFSNNP